MAYADRGGGGLDYCLCHYGASRMTFRGPPRRLDGGYVAVLGGTEAFGKYIPVPFPDLMEAALGRPVVNLAAVNGGVDLYLNEPSLLQIAAEAAVCVVQIAGAQNLSNRFYAVHPRRNDRFVQARPALIDLFPEVDFTEFTFNRHLLTVLQRVSPERFLTVAGELRRIWCRRMQQLLRQLPAAVLLWLADRPPPDAGGIARDPWLVDAHMVADAQRHARELVVVVPDGDAIDSQVILRHASVLEQPSLLGLPGPGAHSLVARRLVPVLRRHLPDAKGPRRSVAL